MALEILLIVAMYMVVATFQGVMLNKSPTDHNAHLFIIRETQRSVFKLPPTPSSIINPSSWGAYPLFLHYIIGKLPLSWLRIVSLIQAPLFTLLLVLITLSYPLDGIDISVSLTCALILFSPVNFDVSNARNFGLGSRAAGQFFLVSLVLLLSILPDALGWGIWFLTVTTAFCVIAFNTFAFQALLIYALVSLLFGNWYPFVVTVTGLFVFVGLFGEYARRYLFDTVKFWNTYRKYLADIFILRNYPSYWITPFVELPKAIKKHEWKRAGFIVWKNTFVNSLIFNPLPWFLVLQMEYYEKIPEGIYHFLVAMFIAFYITSIKYGRFWGEPHRYLEFLMPISAMVLSTQFAGDLGDYAILYAASVIIIQLMLTIVMSRRLHFNEKELEDIEKHIITSESNPTLVSNNTYATKFFMKNDWRFIISWSPEKQLCGMRSYELYSQYPVWKFEVFLNILDEYAPNVLVIYKSEDANIRELINKKYKMIFENENYWLLIK